MCRQKLNCSSPVIPTLDYSDHLETLSKFHKYFAYADLKIPSLARVDFDWGTLIDSAKVGLKETSPQTVHPLHQVKFGMHLHQVQNNTDIGPEIGDSVFECQICVAEMQSHHWDYPLRPILVFVLPILHHCSRLDEMHQHGWVDY
jgi:hypothetical protein